MSDDEIYKANDPAINRSHQSESIVKYREQENLNRHDEQTNSQPQIEDNVEYQSDEEVDQTNGNYNGCNDEHNKFVCNSPKNKMERSTADYCDNLEQPSSSRKDKKRYMDVKKDLAATNQRIDSLAKDFKMLVSWLERKLSKCCIPSDDEADIEEYELLPPLPLKKVSQVISMNDDINSRAYQKQLVLLLRTEGGDDIKKNVINIFNLLFSPKLRTKICWRGTKTGKCKTAFKGLSNILMVVRQAVAYQHKKCSAADIKKECKLCFKQAEKDYDRIKAAKKANM